MSRVVTRTLNVIAQLATESIVMPRTREELMSLKDRHYRMVNPNGIPNVLGFIDCTHVRIYSPGHEDAEIFRNRKGYYSINVQAVGNSKLKVMDLVARWPGSVHDSTIFDNSVLKVSTVKSTVKSTHFMPFCLYVCLFKTSFYLLFFLSNDHQRLAVLSFMSGFV